MTRKRGAVSKYFIVPYQKNESFVGRDGLLRRLYEMLREEKPRQYNHRVALHGLGGVGKTQTALAYVYTRRDVYTSIFWISGVNQASILSDFQQIAIEMEIVIYIFDSESVEIASRVLT